MMYGLRIALPTTSIESQTLDEAICDCSFMRSPCHFKDTSQVAKDVRPQVGLTWALNLVPIGQNDWGPARCVPVLHLMPSWASPKWVSARPSLGPTYI